MAELKTKPTRASVAAFIKSQDDEQTRRDCKELVTLMKQVTGQPPKMWGTSIVGFGNCHLKYASGRELDWFYVGFSPRKQSLSLYLTCDLSKQARQLKKLGKYKSGKGCLYVKMLDDVDRAVLRELIESSFDETKRMLSPRER
ncbi:MAG: DUF1801 domain-containing protein [Pirellulales bacterium]